MEMEATPSEWWPSAGELSNDSLFVSGPRVDSQERALLVSLAKPVLAPRRAEAAAPYPRLIGVLGVDVSFVDLFDDLLYPNATSLLQIDNAFILTTQGAPFFPFHLSDISALNAALLLRYLQFFATGFYCRDCMPGFLCITVPLV